jgi:ABC-2 type transport system ATP-binding protein
MDKLVQVTDLTKTFIKANGSSYTAVDGISFDLNSGEIFSFLGPNGAGKSTTINMMTTQMTVTRGQIIIDGINALESPIEVRQKFGVVAQHNNLDRNLTAFENLVYHGQYFGMTKNAAVARATELLHEFGLFEWRSDYVKSFSGGMSQRLKIARAIMHKPQILFLDEPTTGLDPQYRDVLWRHVLDLKEKNNTTVFLTTHYMEEPERFSDRIAIYAKGTIKAVGTLNELRQLVPTKDLVYLTTKQVLSEEFLTAVSHLISVKKVSQQSSKELILYATTGSLALTETIQLLQTHQLELATIRLANTSLEDIFVYLTTDDKGGTAND